MDNCNVVVAGDDISKGGQTLFNALDLDSVWERVAEVLELLEKVRNSMPRA